eukprot:TRINITY_DN14110_c0_g1_i1.p1 TRINITY_DN14110_c0_g1~~TRINITY_DN14110_c0_g1_i1.p1  ORF type:complete len:384 (-),score=44.80 TRINITY_DN14110_c0_g1_i1:52-1203(-)
MRRFRPPGLDLKEVKTAAKLGDDTNAKVKELYDMGEELGAGSSSMVYKAVRRSDGKLVALKKCHDSDDDEKKKSLEREYELMRNLVHATVLRTWDFHKFTYAACICVEFCPDGDLHSYVEKKGAFGEVDTRMLGEQLLSGVNYMHAKRVVHRDIKPQNVLLTEGASEIRIADFGSAKQIGFDGCSAMLTDRGTGIYSAPELLFGGVWNERIDIWGCGHCLFHMVQAALPFDAQDAEVKACLKKGFLPPIEWRKGVDELTRNLVERCLVVDPFRRPPLLELLQHAAFTRVHRKPANSFSDDEPPDELLLNDWQEKRNSFRLLQRLADNSLARQSSPTSPLTPADSSDGGAFGPNESGQAPYRHRRKCFTTHGAEHQFGTSYEQP